MVRINRPTLLGEIKECLFDFAPGLTGFAGQSESYKSLPASAIDCFRIKKSQSFQELNFVDWNQNVHTRVSFVINYKKEGSLTKIKFVLHYTIFV